MYILRWDTILLLAIIAVLVYEVIYYYELYNDLKDMWDFIWKVDEDTQTQEEKQSHEEKDYNKD